MSDKDEKHDMFLNIPKEVVEASIVEINPFVSKKDKKVHGAP
jgi:hypothetical protein